MPFDFAKFQTDTFDREGHPITMAQYGVLHGDKEYVQVARTEFGSDVLVSTVWLGIDHQFGDGPPLIFETMVFGGHLDGEQDRYSTEREARDGHHVMCDRVRKSKKFVRNTIEALIRGVRDL